MGRLAIFEVLAVPELSHGHTEGHDITEVKRIMTKNSSNGIKPE